MKFPLLIVVLISGCASVVEMPMNVKPIPGNCKGYEVRTSLLSTQGAIMCWNDDGSLAGMTGGSGTPGVQVPLVIIDAAGTIIGAGLLAEGLKQLKDIDIEHSGGVDVEPVIPEDIPPGYLGLVPQ